MRVIYDGESIVQRDVAQLCLDSWLSGNLRRSALSIEEIEAELGVDLDGPKEENCE